ncbi:MAG: hypothetical protein ACR5KV_05295 [Wolbachia sp.]
MMILIQCYSRSKKRSRWILFSVEGNDKDCSRVVYISDKNGNRLTKYDDYEYKYKPDTAELEIIDSLIKAEQKFTLQKGQELSDTSIKQIFS